MTLTRCAGYNLRPLKVCPNCKEGWTRNTTHVAACPSPLGGLVPCSPYMPCSLVPVYLRFAGALPASSQLTVQHMMRAAALNGDACGRSGIHDASVRTLLAQVTATIGGTRSASARGADTRMQTAYRTSADQLGQHAIMRRVRRPTRRKPCPVPSTGETPFRSQVSRTRVGVLAGVMKAHALLWGLMSKQIGARRGHKHMFYQVVLTTTSAGHCLA